MNTDSEVVIAVGKSARMAIRVLSLMGGLALAGCATAPAIQHPSPQLEHQWLTHQQNLARLHSWVISGRLGIQMPHEGWHVSFRWEQGGAELYHITLSGPLGQESAELQGTPQRVTLLLSNGHSVSAPDPDELLMRQLGWRLPIKGLYYWVRGLPVPHRQETHGLNAQGRLQWLEQSGWHIAYRRYEDVAGSAFPTKIFLNSAKVKVRLVIHEWTLS
ncbi:MAG: lipoprotein insertase outer membrane protein LolB [Gammaproteobacteria bacterium]